MTTHSRLVRSIFRASLPAVLAVLTAAPASAGLDWGSCPTPGGEGDELGTDRYFVSASGADDDMSGGKSCTLRDAIVAVMSGKSQLGCTVSSVGSPGPGAVRAVLLPSESYAYVLDGSELYWEVDGKIGNGALCGHGAAQSAIRAAASQLTAGHRVLHVDGPGELFVYGVAIQYGQTIAAPMLGELPQGGVGPSDGGGALVSGGAFLSVRSSLLSDNFSATWGGGLSCSSPLAPCYDLDHVVVAGNHAEGLGGGIYGNGNITSSIIADNTAGGSGGGLYTSLPSKPLSAPEGGGPVPTIMRNTWITSNNAIDGGGGWYNSGYGEAAGVTISANHAFYGGGLVISGTVNENLNNVTVSGNQVEPGAPPLSGGGETMQAGGVLLFNFANANFFNVTISGNRVIEASGPAFTEGGPVGAGLVVAPGSLLEYRQSFIAGNIRELKLDLDDDCSLPKGFFSGGYNRAGVGCDDSGEGDMAAVKTDLLPLTDNGGLTSMDPMLDRTLPGGGFLPTHALAADSDAIDGGPPSGCFGVLGNSEVVLGTDARGFPRAVDGDNDLEPICDIGAFEFKANPAIWIDGFESKGSPCNWSEVIDGAGLCGIK